MPEKKKSEIHGKYRFLTDYANQGKLPGSCVEVARISWYGKRIFYRKTKDSLTKKHEPGRIFYGKKQK